MHYKNLDKIYTVFVAGSVVHQIGTTVDCLAEVSVELRDSGANILATTETDVFGDFRFDGLKPDGPAKTILILNGTKPTEVPLRSNDHDQHVGTIML